VLKNFFRMWVMVATHDLILPFIPHPPQLDDQMEQMISEHAVQGLEEFRKLARQNAEQSIFIMNLMLYVISLCCFSGGSAPRSVY
jgi:hypothetical protein